jgi:hypothetical protein
VRLLSLLIAAVVVCGTYCTCGTPDPYPPPGIDEELYPYYERFLADVAARKLPLKHHVRSIRWTDETLGGSRPGSMTIGVCETWESWLGPKVYTFRKIYIRRDVDKEALPRLMYHELSHCMLGFKKHSISPDDIMYYIADGELTDEARDAMFEKYVSGEDYTEE